MFYAESIKYGVKAVTPSVNHTIGIRYIVREDWLSNGVVIKTQVLHFRVKSTPLKDTNGKGKFERMFSFLFVD